MSQSFVHDYLPQNYRIAQNFTDAFNTSPSTEVDLYNDSIPAGTFLQNGNELRYHYAGGGNVVSNSGVFTDHIVRLYFSGVKVFDSNTIIGGLVGQASINWILKGNVVRDTSTSVKFSSYYAFYGTDFDIGSGGQIRNLFFIEYVPITGLNFNLTSSMRLTGFCQSASFVTASLSKTVYNL